MMRIFALVFLLAAQVEADNRTIVVTGATGRSGSHTYLLLKSAGVNVRGLVRNASKAREYLGCTKCDESEGIFVGDVTSQQSMAAAMTGADSLIIATGRSGKEDAKSLLWDAVETQVRAFLDSPGPLPKDRHVMLISMQFTTLLDTLWNKIIAHIWGGWSVGFYTLQGEAFVMEANVPFTILKACGLDDSPPGQKQVLVGHEDRGWSMLDAHSVSRQDVARVLAAAATNPRVASGLRMDICSKDGTPQAALDIIKEAYYPWDPRKPGAVV